MKFVSCYYIMKIKEDKIKKRGKMKERKGKRRRRKKVFMEDEASDVEIMKKTKKTSGCNDRISIRNELCSSSRSSSSSLESSSIERRQRRIGKSSLLLSFVLIGLANALITGKFLVLVR